MARLAAVLALVAGCAAPAVAPMGAGGRFTPDPDEVTLWRQAEQEEGRLLRAVPRYDDPALDDYLSGVAARLVPAEITAAGAPPIRVLVLRDPAPNAFAMPDGRLYVSTGVLARLESEAQLAAVLAHELAHVVRRDALRIVRAGRRWPFAGSPAASPQPGPPPTNPFRVLGLRVATLAAVDGYGSAAEREADAAALERLAAGDHDPREARRAHEALRQEAPAEDAPEAFLLGQRAWLDERIASVAALLDRQAGPPPATAPAPSSGAYARRVRKATRDNALLEARADRFEAARRQLDRALRLEPADPVAHLCGGEVDRLEAQRLESAAERARLLARARQAYERAIGLDPAYAEPWRQLGLLHYQEHDPAGAREAFGRYLALQPDAPDARRIREFMLELYR